MQRRVAFVVRDVRIGAGIAQRVDNAMRDTTAAVMQTLVGVRCYDLTSADWHADRRGEYRSLRRDD